MAPQGLQDSDEYRLRLESILDNIVDGLITIDERGIVQSFNKACERIFGYKAAEIVGQNIKMLMPEPYSSKHDQYIHNYRTSGHAKIIGIGREVEGRRKDGSIFPLDLSVAEVKIGDQRIFSGIIRDITERKNAERFTGLLTALVQSSKDAIYSKTLTGVITSWNKGAEQILGYTGREIVGQPVGLILPPDRVEEERHIIAEVRSGHSFDSIETVRRHKDGRQIPVSLTVSPILDPAGAIIGASVVARDMTERLMQEEQLRRIQKMEAVGQLTSGVAHDFNNLLTVVLGNTRLMRKRIAMEKSQAPVFADITERIDDIDTAAQRGADLVKRLMVFTRQRPLQKTVVDMNICIQETKGLLARVMGEKVEIRALNEKVGSVLIDQDQFVNALINMAANARDAMPDGGIFTIGTSSVILDKRQAAQYPTLASGRYVVITVSDTGTGMPDHVRQRIFDPFYTTKPAGLGTGLGLSMVYGLIQQSGGHIEVESAPGHGTAFRIFLPVHDGAPP